VPSGLGHCASDRGTSNGDRAAFLIGDGSGTLRRCWPPLLRSHAGEGKLGARPGGRKPGFSARTCQRELLVGAGQAGHMWPRYLTLWPRRPLDAIPPKRWIVKAPGILLPQGCRVVASRSARTLRARLSPRVQTRPEPLRGV